MQNRYNKRRVDPAASKACFICYRPTASVMVNESPQADFFYICDSHLTDPQFAKLAPEYEESVRLNQQQLEKQQEVEQLKKEWDEKHKQKADDKNSDHQPPPPPPPPVPVQAASPPLKPIYTLNQGVFKLRLNSKRSKAQEKKTKSILETPGLFPEVPKHKPV